MISLFARWLTTIRWHRRLVSSSVPTQGQKIRSTAIAGVILEAPRRLEIGTKKQVAEFVGGGVIEEPQLDEIGFSSLEGALESEAGDATTTMGNRWKRGWLRIAFRAVEREEKSVRTQSSGHWCPGADSVELGQQPRSTREPRCQAALR